MATTRRMRRRAARPKARWMPYAFVGLVTLALVLMVSAFALRGGVASSTDQPAPDFSLTLFDGANFRLSEQRGQVVVVNLWASWCPPCRREMPALEKVWQEYRGRGVVFVGVAVDDADADSLAFMRQVGIDYPVGPDRTNAISNRYALSGLPVTTVIDPDGRISARKAGEVTESELRSYIERALR